MPVTASASEARPAGIFHATEALEASGIRRVRASRHEAFLAATRQGPSRQPTPAPTAPHRGAPLRAPQNASPASIRPAPMPPAQIRPAPFVAEPEHTAPTPAPVEDGPEGEEGRLGPSNLPHRTHPRSEESSPGPASASSVVVCAVTPPFASLACDRPVLVAESTCPREQQFAAARRNARWVLPLTLLAAGALAAPIMAASVALLPWSGAAFAFWATPVVCLALAAGVGAKFWQPSPTDVQLQSLAASLRLRAHASPETDKPALFAEAEAIDLLATEQVPEWVRCERLSQMLFGGSRAVVRGAAWGASIGASVGCLATCSGFLLPWMVPLAAPLLVASAALTGGALSSSARRAPCRSEAA